MYLVYYITYIYVCMNTLLFFFFISISLCSIYTLCPGLTDNTRCASLGVIDILGGLTGINGRNLTEKLKCIEMNSPGSTAEGMCACTQLKNGPSCGTPI